jgi:hypothetical protein
VWIMEKQVVDSDPQGSEAEQAPRIDISIKS